MGDHVPEEIEFSWFRGKGSPHWSANAVNDFASRQTCQMIEHLVVYLERPVPIPGFDPGSLRLNLENIKKLGMAIYQRIEGA